MTWQATCHKQQPVVEVTAWHSARNIIWNDLAPRRFVAADASLLGDEHATELVEELDAALRSLLEAIPNEPWTFTADGIEFRVDPSEDE